MLLLLIALFGSLGTMRLNVAVIRQPFDNPPRVERLGVR